MASSPVPQAPGTPRWRVFAIAWVLLSLITTVWAVALPLTAGPDEPAHFVKAASVVRGQLLGDPGKDGTIVQVPQYVAWTQNQLCMAYLPELSAACTPPVPGDPAEIVDGLTTAGPYNPVYYALVGWPSLVLHDQAGLYAMRIVSAVLASGLLALCFFLVHAWRRRTLATLGLLVAITPMVFFVNGIVNPSSLEISATLAAFVAMLSVVLSPNDRLLPLRAIILAGTSALALNTRAISPLWVAAALLTPLILLRRNDIAALFRRRPVWIAAAVTVLAAVLGVAWTLLTNSVSFASPGADQAQYDDVGATPLFGFVKMIMLTFTFGHDMIGNLGWFDTQLPLGAYYIWAGLIGCLLVLSAILLRGRRAVLAIVLLLVLLIGPAVSQAAFIHAGGFIWQGRYTLPIFLCFLVGLAALLGERLGALDGMLLRRLSYLVAFVWALSQVLSFLQALRRYTVGASGSFTKIFAEPSWAPPLGTVASMGLLGILIAAFAAVVVWWARPSESDVLSPDAGSAARGSAAAGPDAARLDGPDAPSGVSAEGYSPAARG